MKTMPTYILQIHQGFRFLYPHIEEADMANVWFQASLAEKVIKCLELTCLVNIDENSDEGLYVCIQFSNF